MKKKRSYTWLIHTAVILVILLAAFSPMISVIIASAIADANGCELDEGSAHPCIVNGEDMGDTLYMMGMMGWFMIASIPLGLGAVLVYLLILLIVWVVRRFARSGAPASP